MKKIYYAAVGDNGGVVASSYEQALLYKKYLRGHVYTKKFFDFTERLHLHTYNKFADEEQNDAHEDYYSHTD